MIISIRQLPTVGADDEYMSRKGNLWIDQEIQDMAASEDEDGESSYSSFLQNNVFIPAWLEGFSMINWVEILRTGFEDFIFLQEPDVLLTKCVA
jgi:hypothetical protein